MKKTKRFVAMLVVGLMVMGLIGITSFAAERDVQVTVDGKHVVFQDAKPYIDQNQRTLVPIAFTAQALGANVVWDADNFKVIIDKGEDTIVLKIGSNKVDLNGTTVTIDTAAALKDSRTFVPLAFISQCLGANVQWEESAWTVIITTAGNVPPVVVPPVEIPEGEVDLKDYFEIAPIDSEGYPVSEKMKDFTFMEVPLADQPFEVKEIVPMANMGNIPGYVVDMGIIVRTKEKAAVAVAVIDKEGRYFTLTKTADYQYSNDFFISTEVAYVIEYTNSAGVTNPKAYISKVDGVYTGFSGTGEKDTTNAKNDSPKAWEKIKATIK